MNTHDEQKLPMVVEAAREAREIWERRVNDGWMHRADDLEDARKLVARLADSSESP